MKLLRNDFFIAFLLLLAYMLTNPYIYGWDDQHLEIPILKHLIDPTLYKGDYYVESASKYFTSWLYPILAKLITVKEIPTVYFWLFVFSRYIMFYWVYRLWLLLSGSVFTAVCTMVAFFILGRTDEFLYRSFCHEEFSFIFMFAGLYYFYRERYFLAALLFGLTVDFHAIYGLFPMLYLLAFLLFCHSQRFKMAFLTGFVFTAAALPFLLWQIPVSISREVAHPVPVSEWMPLYMLSCFQNFIFGSTPLKDVFSNIHLWWENFAPYLFLMALYLFHLVFNPMFRRDKKVQAVIGLSWVMLAAAYYFDYVHPSRFVVDLNVIRVTQYMRFFMLCYTTVWACGQIRDSKPWLALAAAILVLACGTTDLIRLFCLGLVAAVFIIDMKKARGLIFLLPLGAALYFLGLALKDVPEVPLYWKRDIYLLAPMAALFLTLFFQKENLWLRRLLIIIPVAGTFIICVNNFYRYQNLVKTGLGAFQMQRNWEDMQFYVRDHTPKDAMILTPYDMPMGGFRIHSQRKVLVCYRDCGIIGFDYGATLEWQRRIKDIEPFKIFTKGDGVIQAVMVAIFKYKVDYVVFMNYYAPHEDTPLLKKIYQNEVFSLFQVT